MKYKIYCTVCAMLLLTPCVLSAQAVKTQGELLGLQYKATGTQIEDTESVTTETPAVEAEAENTNNGTETGNPGADAGKDPVADGESVEQAAPVDNSGGSCGATPMIPETVCDLGAGFLCVNTPALSVTTDYVIVKGTIDRTNNALADLQVFIQNDYTKTMQQVAFKETLTENCWSQPEKTDWNYCLEANGYYSIKVPITQMGPHTIMLRATRLSGAAAEATVRTTRVIAPEFKRADVTLEPDPSGSGGIITQNFINVDVDLLHDCESCDFLGTSTGGLMVTVANVVEGSGVVKITRKTNLASGGRFRICLPVADGKNNLKISVCNAATGYDTANCPTVSDVQFEAATSSGRVDVISPDVTRQSVFESGLYPMIPLRFKVAGLSGAVAAGVGGSCTSDMVTIEWNKNQPVNLCTIGSDVFAANLVPETGINVGVIRVKDGMSSIEHSFTLGWGKVLSPYNSNGTVKDRSEFMVDGALGISLGGEFITEKFRGIVNNALGSGKLGGLLKSMLGESKPDSNIYETALKAGEIIKIRKEIPYCSSTTSEGGSKQGMRLVGEPVIGSAELQSIALSTNQINLSMDVKNLSLTVRVFKDANKDGVSDNGKSLPLKIAFEHLFVKPVLKLEQGDKPMLLLSSPYTECDYKMDRTCTGKPTLIVPANALGGATKGGGYVLCDSDAQVVDGDLQNSCDGINIINMQTGLINSQVLDLINDKAYCDVSAQLTYMLRKSAKDSVVEVGCSQAPAKQRSGFSFSFYGCDKETPTWLKGKQLELPVGLDAANGRFTLGEQGLSAFMPAYVGDEEYYGRVDQSQRREDVGILVDSSDTLQTTHQPAASVLRNDIDFSLADRLINQLFFALTQSGENGIFDWDIDELFFKSVGFDFVKECDEFDPSAENQKPSALCNLRPRVAEMLGGTLTTEQYFQPKQPLRLSVHGSRDLAPRIKMYPATVPDLESIVTDENGDQKVTYRKADIIELQIPNLEVAFYALKVDPSIKPDKFNNLPIYVDKDGQPVIDSMNPLDADPMSGPIVRFRATLLVALELGGVITDPSDPSSFRMMIRPNAFLSRVIFSSVEGGNATVVSDSNLMSAFKEKINYGINIYGELANALMVKLPKSIDTNALMGDVNDDSSLMNLLGLGTVHMAKGGLFVGADETHHYFRIAAKVLVE